MSRKVPIALAVLLCLALFLPAIAIGQTDVSPPSLDDFSFAPTGIDISAGSAAVVATFLASDDLSGVQLAMVSFVSPGSPLEFKNCSATTPISGTPLAGTFECTINFPQGSQPGIWTVTQVELQDGDGNSAFYSLLDLDGAGFPTELTVSQQTDDTPPTLIDFDFAPSAIDTQTGSANVLATFEVDDDISGIALIKVSFISPGSTSILRGCTSIVFNPGGLGAESGGTFDCEVSFPQFSEAGVWTVINVDVSDVAGNIASHSTGELTTLGFPTLLNVSSNSDLTPPALVDFSFSPESIDTTVAMEAIPATVHATDDLAGIASVSVIFAAPNGTVNDAECISTAPDSGTNLDGIYSCSIPFPRYSPEGVWPVTVELRDSVGNLEQIDAASLSGLALPDDMRIGYLSGGPRASIAAPLAGRSVRGDSVTVRGALILGSPANLSPSLGILFEYRILPFGVFAPIPAAHAAHPNPDSTAPYFIHFDTTMVADGDYEVRAVAHNSGGGPDPAPPVITMTIDNGGATDIDEMLNTDGLQESLTAIDNLFVSNAATADAVAAGSAASWEAPVGALTAATDTLQAIFVDGAGEISRLEQPEQDIGVYVDLSLLSGQITLEQGHTANLSLTYLDINQDGVVDGTAIREEEIELRRHDAASDAYLRIPGTVALVEHNMVHAIIDKLGRYALLGPLLPRISFLPDAASLTWPPVSEALRYHVYRSPLSSMSDGNGDGLPDGGYGDCQNFRDPDPTDTIFLDNDVPLTLGEGFIYFVSYVSLEGERGLGNSSVGLPRGATLLCP